MVTAVELKRFFKRQYGIPVLANTGKNYCGVRIKPNPYTNHRDPITYPYSFPLEFGIRCLRVIYPNSPTLQDHWCGNVGPHDIAMSPRQWDEVLAQFTAPSPPATEVIQGVENGHLVS